MKILIQISIVLLGLITFIPQDQTKHRATYLSPTHISFDGNSGFVYISLSTAGKIAEVDLNTNQLKRYISLPFNPGGTALSRDTKTLMVADKSPSGHLHFISLQSGDINKRISVGHTPDAIAITPDGKQVFVANRFSNTVSVIDLKTNKIIKNISIDRDPISIAISPAGDYLAVANHIPNAASTDDFVSAKISLIELSSLKVVAHIPLANGSQSIRGVIFSKDGKYLYASHILSRNTLPTTQIEHGWINSNAMSIIRVEDKRYHTSVLLDNFNRGAANPAGMSLSEDGRELFVALSGVNELGIIDLPKLHEKIDQIKTSNPGDSNPEFEDISSDLRFLNGIRKRIPIAGKSPRFVTVCGDKILVSSYFSSDLEILSNSDFGNSENISLGEEPEMSRERRGELLFCQADLCFQDWQSCLSCHPDARSDGLNWDLLNDGAGNPKNNKSMLLAHYTPPAMITGIRKNAETAVRAGMKYILFTEPVESDARDIDAYLKALEAVPSPYLKNGRLSRNAKRGKALFKKADCLRCHTGRYHTNGKKYNVGTGINQHKNNEFDVPGLTEVWRTAPYLYDGRAKTMNEVFSKFNSEDRHGITSTLSDKQIEMLVEYVLSL